MDILEILNDGKMVLTLSELPITVAEFEKILEEHPGIYERQDDVFIRIQDRKSDSQSPIKCTPAFFKEKINEALLDSMKNPNNKIKLQNLSVWSRLYPNSAITMAEAKDIIIGMVDSFIPIVISVLKNNLDADSHKISTIQQEIAAQFQTIFAKKLEAEGETIDE